MLMKGFPSFPPDSLVLKLMVLRMSHCPSPTLTAQPAQTVNGFHLLIGSMVGLRPLDAEGVLGVIS